MKLLGYIFLCVLFPLLSWGQSHALSITVENVKTGDGEIYVAIYDKAETFLKSSKYYKAQKFPAKAGQTICKFDDVPSGTYAISIYHDINSSKRLDTNWMGIPSEPYGFANNAKGFLGPPKFEDCLVDIKGDKELKIKLKTAL